MANLVQCNGEPGIAIDSEGSVITPVFIQHRIYKTTSDGASISDWGGNGITDGQFSFPSAIDTDSQNNIYVVDSGNHRIQEFTKDGTFITKWGKQGFDKGQFVHPSGIAIDSEGHVFVSDSGKNTIQEYAIMQKGNNTGQDVAPTP